MWDQIGQWSGDVMKNTTLAMNKCIYYGLTHTFEVV